MEGSKFQARMWLGSYKVISPHHPRYVLEQLIQSLERGQKLLSDIIRLSGLMNST